MRIMIADPDPVRTKGVADALASEGHPVERAAGEGDPQRR